MNNQQNNNYQRKQGKTGPSGFLLAIIISLVLTFFLYRTILNPSKNFNSHQIGYNELIKLIDEKKVNYVTIANTQIQAYYDATGLLVGLEENKNSYKDFAKEYVQNAMQKFQSMSESNVESIVLYTVPRVNGDGEVVSKILQKEGIIIKTVPNSEPIWNFLLTTILPIVMIFVLFRFAGKMMGGGGGIMGIGKSNAKQYMMKATGVSFQDVAGEDEAKESLQEIVDFLHNPSRYTKVGAKLPKGALLVGPPGTGKTLLAKAVAGEAKVPFFSMSGSDFVEMFAGVGASRVRDLFKQAKAVSPCIVFIDEIDAIGRSRDSRMGYGADSEREQTLNQLLSEMDGFEINNGIMVMAATNRPEVLDKALLRPGRFDRRVVVEKPDLKGRVNILKVHAKDVKLDDTVDFEEIALATSGAVGADLANMINESAITAAKMGRDRVSQKDLFDAVEVVLVGKEKKDRILSKEERKIVSYHEVGHALVTALLKNTEPVQKITIVPRTMGALGYVMQTPEEEKYLNTKKELEDRLVTCLAGRAAEEVVFDTVTTGASNDIEQATDLARAMVTQYGMSKKFGLMGLAKRDSMYLSDGSHLECSDETAASVDEEVKNMLKDSYEKAKKILVKYRKALDEIATYLIDKETITGKEFMEILKTTTGIKEEKKERIVEKSKEDKKNAKKKN